MSENAQHRELLRVAAAVERHWTLSDETKQRQSLGQTLAWADPEAREDRIASMRVNYDSERRSDALKKRFEDPEVRAQHGEISRQVAARPEVRAKRVASLLAANERVECNLCGRLIAQPHLKRHRRAVHGIELS